MKHITYFFLLISFSISTTVFTQTTDSDFEIIFNRLYDNAYTYASDTEIDGYLAKLNANGSFSDYDYNTDGDLRENILRITKMATAYRNSSSNYFGDNVYFNKVTTSMDFWITNNHYPSNWWYRYIAYPKEFWKCTVLLSAELESQKPILYQKALDYLLWAYTKPHKDGANGADIIAGSFPASIITKDHAKMLEFKQNIKSLIAIQYKGGGFEPDYMFGQHSGYGRQVYLNNYGKEYFNSILAYLGFVNKTEYDTDESDFSLLVDYMVEGVQWTIFKDHGDPNHSGRFNSSTLGVSDMRRHANTLLNLDPPRKEEMQQVVDRLENRADLSGNKDYWRFDYMIHRRDNYFASSRMTSTRTVGAEAGNGSGEYNYYAGSGVNYIFHHGTEYDGDYFKYFNNRQFPGITAQQDNGTLPIPNWGKYGTNGNIFAGGVSDKNYGVCGMILDKRGVTAHKAWFYFDNEFVALGAGITQTNGTAPVYSNMNQTLSSGGILYSQNNVITTVGTGIRTSTNLQWLIQDDIGYFNLHESNTIKIANERRPTLKFFSANIDHGINPTDAGYAYVVYPGMTESLATAYTADVPVQIISNTANIQAVYHKELDICQAIFYTPGEIELPDGTTIKASEPCAFMYNNEGEQLTFSCSNPRCESVNPETISIEVNKEFEGDGMIWDGEKTTITYDMPQGTQAGQSVIKTNSVYTCHPVRASDFQAPNIPENTRDNDLTTRWSAQGDNQYIEFCLDDTIMLSSVSLAYFSGDQRTTTIDALVSVDGANWTTVLNQKESSGTTLELEEFTFAPTAAWKLRIVGHGNSTSDWNSISEIQWSESTVSSPKHILSEKDIKVYPVPVSHQLQIDLNSTELKNGAIEIYSTSGILAYQAKITSGIKKISIPVQNFSQGIYVLRITDNNNSFSSKFIIE